MTTEGTSNMKVEDLQRGAEDLQSNVKPLILDPTDLIEERLLKLVAERYPGQPAMVSLKEGKYYLYCAGPLDVDDIQKCYDKPSQDTHNGKADRG